MIPNLISYSSIIPECSVGDGNLGMLVAAGANKIIAIDLHAGQIQGFFDQFDHLYARSVILAHIRANFADLKNLVMVSPDAGGVERTRAFAKRLGAGLAIVDKRREKPNKAEAMAIVGDVAGKIAIILDDICDTCGTLTEAEKALINAGAVEVHACCVHPVLSGPAIERITDSSIKSLIVTNTVPLHEKARNCPKIKVLSIAELLSQAILRCYTNDSVTDLFRE